MEEANTLPLQSSHFAGKKRLRVLVAYSSASTHVATTRDYLRALKDYTDFDVSYLHVTHEATLGVDLNAYDIIFQNYCVRLCFEWLVSESYQNALKQFNGLKILSVQDDYDRTSTLHRAIRDLGFHVLLTCIQSEFWPLAYPAHELPGVKIVQGLTGYAPDDIRDRIPEPARLAEREVMLGYRGRGIGARYGRLAFDKSEIGRRMRTICEQRGIKHDIAIDDESRIYGDDWFHFLGRCRALLGAESASNVFDFDGSIERLHEELSRELGRPPTYDEFRPYIDHVEKKFNVGQISPRIFEYAAMKTPMVLFEGRYSDAIQPKEHYILLKKDFSNVDSVLAQLEDLPALESMAERAYAHLIVSGNYGYRSFGRMMQEVILREWGALNRSRSDRLAFPLERETNVQSADNADITIAKRTMLREWPTPTPKTTDQFQTQHDRLSVVNHLRNRNTWIAGQSSRKGIDYSDMVAYLEPALIRKLRIYPKDGADTLFAELKHREQEIVSFLRNEPRASSITDFVEIGMRHEAFLESYQRFVINFVPPKRWLWRQVSKVKSYLMAKHGSEIRAMREVLRKSPALSKIARAARRFVVACLQ